MKRKKNPPNSEKMAKEHSWEMSTIRNLVLKQVEKILEKEKLFIEKVAEKIGLQRGVHGPPSISEATGLDSVKQNWFLVRNSLRWTHQPKQTPNAIVYLLAESSRRQLTIAV